MSRPNNVLWIMRDQLRVISSRKPGLNRADPEDAKTPGGRQATGRVLLCWICGRYRGAADSTVQKLSRPRRLLLTRQKRLSRQARRFARRHNRVSLPTLPYGAG